nr:hypothetical protein [Tanacetum cinerariifolium]
MVRITGATARINFCNELIMKRVANTIRLMDAIAKINDPQCELLLLLSCTERDLVTGNGDLPPYLIHLGGLGINSASDVLNYAILACRLQSADLQTKLLWHTGIVSPESIFDDALSVFNTSMETDLLSNPKSTFSLSPRHMALCTSQREDHTCDWLRTVPISGLGQTMNDKTYHCVLCYRLGIPLFSGAKPCSACSKVFAWDNSRDHAVSCAGIIVIKHRHNVVRDTLVDICYHSGISAGKEVDIELDILLYSWDRGLNVCVNLTGSSPLTQTGMVFVPDRAVIDAAQRKRGKYMDMCAAIGYGFLPFSFSSHVSIS